MRECLLERALWERAQWERALPAIRTTRRVFPTPGVRQCANEMFAGRARSHRARKPAWQGFYQRYIVRGMAPVQVLTALARKLARVAFALMRNQSEYDPLRRVQAQTLMPC
jgi:hypothetical protein